MHFVFVVGSYYPYYSAVGKCTGNVADVLSQKHKVTIICEKNYCDQKDEERYNNQKILRIITQEKINREKLNNNIRKTHGLTRKYYILRSNIYKLIQATKLVFSKISIKKELVDLYISKLADIDEKIDVIIPASMPFESVLAAVEYHRNNPGVIVIPYLFDQFAESATIHRLNANKLIKMKRHIGLEEESLINSYRVLAMHSLKSHFENKLPNLNNIIYTEHPLIITDDCKMSEKTRNSIKISYIGGFYKKYVEPNYLLDLFINSKVSNIEFHFYVIGNCNKMINKYQRIHPRRIINHGSVNKEKATYEMMDSDILVSVSEKSGIQMSSKIFEYMSFGKPIIHFYSGNKDVNVQILENYPLALIIKQDYSIMNENVNKFEQFCLNNYTKRINAEEIKRLFPEAMPKYTASIIESLLGGCHE